jgi:hypothetical protein
MARTGRFLLDTNIAIALFAGETAIQRHLAEASEVFVQYCSWSGRPTAQALGQFLNLWLLAASHANVS